MDVALANRLRQRFFALRAGGEAMLAALHGETVADKTLVGAITPCLRRRVLRLGWAASSEVATRRVMAVLEKVDPAACEHFLAGQCQGIGIGDLPVERLDLIGQWVPSWPDSVLVQGQWGLALMRLGRFVQAETPLRRAAELAPRQMSALLDLGQWHQTQGDFSSAETLLHRAREAAPDCEAPLTALGQNALAQAEPRAAERWFAAAECCCPGMNYIQSWSALAQAMQGHMDEALALAEQSCAKPLVQMTVWLHSNRALVLLAAGQVGEAVAAQRRALLGARHAMVFLDALRPFAARQLTLLSQAADGRDGSLALLETGSCFPS
uniref:Uncharacterized protein n=1 Tax=Magnetospirillum gryphiswaldense TaxID=55518 RepID=A4TV72_9PROT|nr:hypothetical protein MGR_2828 [Magnetospirillum gryphiswaldense MSR-1]